MTNLVEFELPADVVLEEAELVDPEAAVVAVNRLCRVVLESCAAALSSQLSKSGLFSLLLVAIIVVSLTPPPPTVVAIVIVSLFVLTSSDDSETCVGCCCKLTCIWVENLRTTLKNRSASSSQMNLKP